MPTTTVYLPDDLKEALARAAQTEGVSEADLVRRGVRELIEAHAGPRPILPLDDEHDEFDPMLAMKVASNRAESLRGFGDS